MTTIASLILISEGLLYMPSNDWTKKNNELERMWKEATVISFELLPRKDTADQENSK
jgi:hypothetical protein